MGLDYVVPNWPAGNKNIAIVLADMREAVTRANAIMRGLLQLSAQADFEMKTASRPFQRGDRLEIQRQRKHQNRDEALRKEGGRAPGGRVEPELPGKGQHPYKRCRDTRFSAGRGHLVPSSMPWPALLTSWPKPWAVLQPTPTIARKLVTNRRTTIRLMNVFISVFRLQLFICVYENQEVIRLALGRGIASRSLFAVCGSAPRQEPGYMANEHLGARFGDTRGVIDYENAAGRNGVALSLCAGGLSILHGFGISHDAIISRNILRPPGRGSPRGVYPTHFTRATSSRFRK
jgi:hypothetical protein